MRRYMRLKKHLTSFQIIIMGFAGVILAGACCHVPVHQER